MKRILLFGLVMFWFSGCGIVQRGTIPWENTSKPTAVKNKRPDRPVSAPPATNAEPVRTASVAKTANNRSLNKAEKEVKAALDLAYKDWKGVPYILGGAGYSGVDCSAFMQIVFEDYFEVMLPRNTQEQLKTGKGVKKKDIKMGDMVFFKTGRKTYHVGVMINEAEFLHASTSSGVMISNVQDRYWQDVYIGARRVL